MGLLNELQNQGLLSTSEKQVAEGLDRAKRVVSQRKVGGEATPYTNSYLDSATISWAACSKIIHLATV